MGRLGEFSHLCKTAAGHVRDVCRSATSLGWAARNSATNRWHSPEFMSAFEKSDPLVSICIATYNRARLLTERALPSLLAQTHRNIEVIVVGDACSDDSAERIAALNDARVRYLNLPIRGPYPAAPEQRWMVAGSFPMNRALREAQGDFVTHLDDDDEHAPDRIEKLLHLLRSSRCDFAYHPFKVQQPDWSWWTNPASWFVRGYVTTSSVLYHRYWKAIEWDVEAWRRKEPGDWNRFRRVRYLGARLVRHPHVMLTHYREQNQPSRTG